MNFNDYYWHDAVIKNIFIDRKNPGYEDTISFDILWTWPNEKFNQIVFEDVYWSRMILGFGIIADECIFEAYEASNDDLDLINFLDKWKGIFDVNLNCYVIKTSSTGSEIKILAKGFKVIE